MKLKMIALAAAAMAASATANASVTLNVSGKVTPPSCQLSLTKADLDLGNFHASKLSENQPTHIGRQSTDVLVSCASKSQFALLVKDDRSGTVADDAVAVANTMATADQAYGLGVSGSNNIGAYVISLNGGTADAHEASFVKSDDQGTTWTAATVVAPNQLTAWQAQDGALAAASATNARATLTIDAAVVGTEHLDLTNEVSLDGRATIELQYL
ncbi:DUF1120 domain-containing protein [Stenotrophomonas maltophilia]|uniref:DUF1120 domain-containing protein n=1 Tax=Stenotrophomonas maltophilia TaxID=40324 RepID=UPI00166150A2|nr:DUF1120 domain-containing protein [Stenotrophomonas maltophilia]